MSKRERISSVDFRNPFIVGDIHGCFDEFLKLLEKINYNKKKHRLILAGDIINRGPKSFDMLRWVKNEGVEVILGNHEQAFIKGVEKDKPLSSILRKLKNDMGETVKEWVQWISSWPLYIEEEDFMVVHAGLVPGEHPRHSEPDFLMNIRTWDGKGENIKDESNPPWYTFYKGEKLLIYGHWAKQGLMVRGNTIGLDSGCVYGKSLSGILLPERRIVQTSAFRNYTNLRFE